jgi:hypothetical protein
MIFERSLALCLVSPSAVMMRRSCWTRWGLFDETLPACEDYDLWLRIAWKHPIHLIDQPLIVKRGGHADQLSRMPELDKYRIQSIARLLDRGCPHPEPTGGSRIAMLKTKCTIYAQGCRKRNRVTEAFIGTEPPFRPNHFNYGFRMIVFTRIYARARVRLQIIY